MSKLPISRGIAWYADAESYEQIRAASTDSAEMHDTFNEWLAMAESYERAMNKTGSKVSRVPLNPLEFFAWCKSQGHNVDTHARELFVSTTLARKEFKKQAESN
jgi:hypothetical protein